MSPPESPSSRIIQAKVVAIVLYVVYRCPHTYPSTRSVTKAQHVFDRATVTVFLHNGKGNQTASQTGARMVTWAPSEDVGCRNNSLILKQHVANADTVLERLCSGHETANNSSHIVNAIFDDTVFLEERT